MEPNESNQAPEPLKQPPQEEYTPVSNELPIITPVSQHQLAESPTPRQSSNRVKILLIIVAILIFAVAVIGYLALRKSAPTNITHIPSTSNTVVLAPAKVTITKDGFVPATITVKINQAVTWTNEDTAQHEVASDPYPTDNALAGFNDKQPLNRTDTFDFIFNKTGTY